VKNMCIALIVSMLANVVSASQFALFPVEAAVARVPGVHAGDWAKYEVVYNYTTNDPNSPYPPPPPGITDIESYKVEVQSVTGTNITFQTTIRFGNGTKMSWTMWTDVSSWLQTFPNLLIAANLSVGDTVYKEPYSAVINATLTRRYAWAEREVNYFGQRGNYTSPYPSFQEISEMHVYWDRSSGVLAEYVNDVQYTKLKEGYVTRMFTRLVIKETNIWERTEIVKVNVRFSPRVLNLKSRGKWALVEVELPREYKSRDVDTSSITLNDTITPKGAWKLGHHWLLLRFKRAEIISLIKDQISIRNRRFIIIVSLTISGELKDGVTFEGTNKIGVINWRNFHARTPFQKM